MCLELNWNAWSVMILQTLIINSNLHKNKDLLFDSLLTCPRILREESQIFQLLVHKQLQCGPLICEGAL